MNDLQSLLNQFVKDPENEFNNINLALYYHSINQTASAVSYYIRTAERTEDKNLMYSCLLSAAKCFDSQGCRGNSVKGLLQSAVSICPKRPEGYFFLSRFYEKEKNYQDSYLISSIGLEVSDDSCESLPLISLTIDYPGKYGILFEKAVSSWWVGLCDDSRDYFLDLKNNYWDVMDEIHRKSVNDNLKFLKADFDWGSVDEEYKNLFHNENFIDRIYEKHFEVCENDIVLDFGANCGSFTYSIFEKNPKKVFCVEPSLNLVKTLKKNIKEYEDKVTIINKAISDHNSESEIIPQDDVFIYCNDLKTYDTITFKNIVKDNNISTIDFLKSDCEGGEYFIFTEENSDFIKNNVKRISGEFHITGWKDSVEKFKIFRDYYLKSIRYSDGLHVYERCGKDVTQKIFDDGYLEEFHDFWNKTNPYFGNFMVYIDYEKAKSNIKIINLYDEDRNKKWKNSISPTMEFTTSIDTQNGCVVDCVFCPQRTLQKSYKGERFMTLDNFTKAVDKLPKEIRVTFAGFTEPWLNKYCTDMVLYAHEKGHPISVFTTGIGMDIKDIERIKHIPFAGGPNGGFVLHLPDQERKAKHPITDRYIKVIEKFGEVHSEIQNFTLMCMGTVHESVRHIFPEAPNYQMWSRAGNLLGESIMKPELLNRKDEYRSIYHGEQSMTCGCLEELYHNVMLPNGDVSLCCMDYGLEHILGNLLDQDYEDVIPENNKCFNLCKFCENAKLP